MKIAVWSTGHTIADTVARAMQEGLPGCGFYNTYETLGPELDGDLPEADVHIAYGILRGTAEVFRKAQGSGKFWVNLDRGYLKPDHFGGYYRISLFGTQYVTPIQEWMFDETRFKKLGITLESWRGFDRSKPVLICPPTEYVKGFFDDIDDIKWLEKATSFLSQNGFQRWKIIGHGRCTK